MFATVVAVASTTAALPARAAFVVDQVQLRREGADAVLEVAFTTPVQFQRLVATASGGVAVLSYRLLAIRNRDIGSGSQLMALDHLKGFERLRLTDEPDRGEQDRRLVLQMGQPLDVSARAGRDNQHLEFVLQGQGAALVAPEAPPPARAAAPGAPEDAARGLLDSARAALAAGQPAQAQAALEQLLALPPNAHTADAQALAGDVALVLGDAARARAEFETYLDLYPHGAAAARVRDQLAALPAAPPALPAPDATPARADEEVTVYASTSMTYYGGNGRIRSQDFQDSPISGLPEVVGDPQFSDDRTRQLFNDVDLNWRRRSDTRDQRFVFRDSYLTDLERPDKSRNRLSALYFDHKSRSDGWGGRIGRQSPLGGGVMGRFDGVQGYVMARPQLKLGATAGVPTDRFFDSRRHFYGASVDADSLIGNLGVGGYVIEQRIDREIDRRALGLDLRYFEGGLSVFSQFDYDVLMKGLNIATVQGTYVSDDNTVYNALYDRRTLSMLSLGNALTFEDAAQPGVLYTRIADRLANTTLEALREQVRRITPIITQAQLGVTRPITAHWQTGGSVQLTNIGAIPPVPDVAGYELGRPATGDIVTVSAQLIGLNLYSTRDTHVFTTSVIRSPAVDALVLAYNNSSYAWDTWQFEPSLQYYRDRTPQGSTNERWTPGLRVTYRGWKRWAIETALTYELGDAMRTQPGLEPGSAPLSTQESSSRVNYSLGARFEF